MDHFIPTDNTTEYPTTCRICSPATCWARYNLTKELGVVIVKEEGCILDTLLK